MIRLARLGRIARSVHVVLALSLLGSSGARAQNVVYVKPDATGRADGSNWDNAFTSLQRAFQNTPGNAQYWVAAGVYKPTSVDDRDASFNLLYEAWQGLYGGFAGWEESLDQRVGLFAETVLSGEIGNPATADDNSLHVLLCASNVVDGFTITNGNATLPGANQWNPNQYGGGVYCYQNYTPVFRNCTFTRNQSARHGGAVYSDAANVSFIDCTFSSNSAGGGGYGVLSGFGGAIATPDSLSAVTCNNVVFTSNTARSGGAVFAGPVALQNCVFSRNWARDNGGGIFVRSVDSALSLCTFSRNGALGAGGGLYLNSGSTADLSNSILWDNANDGVTDLDAQLALGPGASANLRFCILQGMAPGSFYDAPQWFNRNGDPLFVAPQLDDVRLNSGSPAIDSGSNALIARDVLDVDGDGNTQEPIPFDLASESRVFDHIPTPDSAPVAGVTVDRGANEAGTDCNLNGFDDVLELPGNDCNSNGVPDDCDTDCNGNGVPDTCEAGGQLGNDCNQNGVPDDCEWDCNDNDLPDECELATGALLDCNGNGVGDACEGQQYPNSDCTQDGIPDECQLADGTLQDLNGNGIPDVCALDGDCDGNGISDLIELAQGSVDCDGNNVVDACEGGCNANGIPDSCDLAAGTSLDCNANGIPDECDIGPDWPDCNQNLVPDVCDLQSGASNDVNANGIPDECASDGDCDADGISDVLELLTGAEDCDGDMLPDNCELAFGPRTVVDGTLNPGSALLGWDVAVDGDWFVTHHGQAGGAVHLYRRDASGAWLYHSFLTEALPANADYGEVVALEGDSLCVAAYDEGRGAVYAYRYDPAGDAWEYELTLRGDPDTANNFGWSLDLDGDRVVIGSEADTAGATWGGAAYVFVRDANDDWAFEQRLLATNPGFNDRFGTDVSISGDWIVVGSPFEYSGAADSGAAYLYQLVDGAWVERQRLLSSSPTLYGYFGSSVSIHSQSLAVGAPGPNEERVHLHLQVAPTVWAPEDSLRLVGTNGTDFGSDVVILGDRLFVSAPDFNADGLNDSGAVFSYQRTAALQWEATGSTTALEPTVLGGFGRRLAFDGSTLAVGDPRSLANDGRFHLFADSDSDDDGALDDCACGNAIAFCASTPNTSGNSAEIGYSGSGSLAADDSVLTVTGAAPNTFGLFFHGDLSVGSFPVGDGLLCVGGNQIRMPIVVTDAQGNASFPIDFAANPQIAAGNVRYFQFFFRDLGPSGFDLSGGIQVEFCP